MTGREETKYNLFIGKSKDGEYIFLEESFAYDDGMSGLTGTSFAFLTEYELDERIEDYDWLELWKEAVYHGHCTQGYNDWVEEIKDNGDAEMTVRDDSYCGENWLINAMDYANEKENMHYSYSDCVGGGRMFDEDNIKEDYYEYFIPENLELLQKLYKEFEK